MTLPEPNFDALYRDLILEHYKAPHGKMPLAREDIVTEGMNPICGDEVDVALEIGWDGRVAGVRVDGRGCAISVSSGSILHDLIQRYLVLLGYKLTSSDRLLWSFKRGSSAGEWSCDVRRCKTRLGIAAFEVSDGYRVDCSLDVDGSWGSWVTQKEMRLLTRELEGLEDLLRNGAAGGPVRAERWESNLEEVRIMN